MADVPQMLKEDESLEIASKSFQRIIDAASKRGYREGSVTASEQILQRGFDEGYVDAFRVAFALGRYKSMMCAMPGAIECPLEIRTVLEKSRRAACYICKFEREVNAKYLTEKSFSHIRNDQVEESNKILGRLYEYFKPLINEDVC